MTEWMGTILMKRARKLGYLFKEGVHNMFSHGFMSFAAICVTVACLVIIGSFSMIVYNMQLMVQDLEQRNRILVYIDENYNTAEAKSVGSQINLVNNVQQAVFQSRTEAMERFVAQQGGGEAYAGIDASTFRDRFIVTLEDNALTQQTVDALRQIKGVADIAARSEIAEGFTTLQRILNIGSVAIIVVLLVVSLFMISNTIKLAMYDRREEIGIMKIIGATNRFIRFPYFVEGFLIGVISGAVAFFLEWGVYDLLTNRLMRADSVGLLSSLVPFKQVLWVVAIAFGVTGLLVGIIGSVMSIRRFLDV